MFCQNEYIVFDRPRFNQCVSCFLHGPRTSARRDRLESDTFPPASSLPHEKEAKCHGGLLLAVTGTCL